VSLFEPDILNEGASPSSARRLLTPERRLLIAILSDAVDCYRNNVGAQTSKARRLHREAEHWILDDDRMWVFSFRNICDALGVDAEAMRARTRVWKARRPSNEPRSQESRLNSPSRCVI